MNTNNEQSSYLLEEMVGGGDFFFSSDTWLSLAVSLEESSLSSSIDEIYSHKPITDNRKNERITTTFLNGRLIISIWKEISFENTNLRMKFLLNVVCFCASRDECRQTLRHYTRAALPTQRHWLVLTRSGRAPGVCAGHMEEMTRSRELVPHNPRRAETEPG